jgi:hypothetical protein
MNCVKIARHPRLVSYNSEANVRIVKKAKPRRYLCQNSKFLNMNIYAFLCVLQGISKEEPIG